MKSIAAITILASSAAAFAPAPVSKVESSLNYAAELDNMIGVTPETGNKVVSLVFCYLIIVCQRYPLVLCYIDSVYTVDSIGIHAFHGFSIMISWEMIF